MNINLICRLDQKTSVDNIGKLIEIISSVLSIITVNSFTVNIIQLPSAFSTKHNKNYLFWLMNK